jgi:hypothetical protein
MTMQTGDVRLMPLDSVRSWSVIAESVSALDPDVVEALDSSGAILRVLSGEQLERPEPTAPPPPPPPAKVQSQDPETRRLEVVCGLVAEAYRHSTEVAFARMVDLFEAVNQRQASQEKSLENMHKLLRRALQDQLEDAAEMQANAKPEDFVGDLAKSFLGGMAGGEHPTNGKAKA